jgi:hypothetical protein
MKLKIIVIALIALLAITVAPTVVAARDGHVQQTLPTLVVRPVYAFSIVGWTRGPQVGVVVFNTQTGKFVLAAYGVSQPPSGLYNYFGVSTGPLPPSTTIYYIAKGLDVSSQGSILEAGHLSGPPYAPLALIDQQIANGGVFFIFAYY